MKFVLIATAALILTGCASHSLVAPLGGDQFTISKQASTGFTGLGNMKAELLQEGQEHCRKLGKEFKATHTTETKPPYIFGNYPRVDVTFACQ